MPGGLARDGCLERRARFRALTGRVEQMLIGLERDVDRPHYVTAVLDSALESIGKQPVDSGQAADLCVADRQYLMLRLGALLYGEQMWLKVVCLHCESLFDVEVQRSDLPVKDAGQDFPTLTVRMKNREIVVRVPTGADQERIAEESEAQAFQHLLEGCVHSVNGETPDEAFFHGLSEADVKVIDEALDEASPAVCSQLRVTCPECERTQSVELDHYDLAGMNDHSLYDEVHSLASHYHWSEASILDLPRARRRLYLDLINRSKGMVE